MSEKPPTTLPAEVAAASPRDVRPEDRPDDPVGESNPEGPPDGVRNDKAAGSPVGDSAAAPGAPGAAETSANPTPLFRTAKEIAAATPSTLTWIAWPLVAAGAITAIVGKVKAAGKSTLVSLAVAAVLARREFLGKPTTKTPVVWLTEEPDLAFRQLLARAGLLESDDLHVLSHYLTRGQPWEQVAAMAIGKAQAVGSQLAIVDTHGTFTGLIGDAENKAGESAAAVRAIGELAAPLGIGVILVSHARKAGGEIEDAARGSSAFIGAVDHIVWVQRHDATSHPNRRLLETLGRLDSPSDLVIERTDEGYLLLGTVDEVKEQTAKDAILNALPTDAGVSLTVEQLAEETGIGRTSIREILVPLEKSGDVLHVGLGRRGSPFRYFRKPLVADSAAGDSAAAGGPPGAAARTTETHSGQTEPGATVTSEQQQQMRLFVAEVLYVWLLEQPAPPNVEEAEAFLWDACRMPRDEARDLIEQFAGELWEIVAALVEEGCPAEFFLVTLPKQE